MSANPGSLRVVALLHQKPASDRYEFRIRWMMGDADRMPRDDEYFHVRVYLSSGAGGVKRYLDASGTFGQAGGPATFIRVEPMLLAMIDPPRTEVFPDAASSEAVWRVGYKPTVPVTPPAPTKSKLDPGEGFGVVHLLKGMSPARSQFRAESLLRNAMNSLLASPQLSSLSGQLSGFADEPGAAAAAKLAEAIVRGGHTPSRIRKNLPTLYRDLLAKTRTHLADAPDRVRAAGILDLAHPDPSVRWSYAALASVALSDRALIRSLDQEVVPSQQSRQQLRLRSLSGGTLIDFWCATDGAARPCDTADDALRGKQYPASHLLGTGLALGDFSQADIQGWDDSIIVVEVEQANPAPPRGFDPGRGEVNTDHDVPLDPGSAVIFRDDVQNAVTLPERSSLPPPAPRSAQVSYEMRQTSGGPKAPDDQQGESDDRPSFQTGEGRVEIHITPGIATPPEWDPTRGTSVCGFNVYGMWMTPQTAPFFAEGSPAPTLDQLKPWRITRRYSFERDLRNTFPNIQNAEHPGMTRALADPPWDPILMRPSEVRDMHEEGQGQALPTALQENVEVVWNFDLRTGMNSGAQNPPPSPVGWDPQGKVNTAWSPQQNRDGSGSGPQPQGYRFWVTAVDFFEQESAPVAVEAFDGDLPAPSGIARYIFRPVRRTPPLPPPAPDNAVQGLSLSYDSAASLLRASWETPFENQVAGFDTSKPPARLDPRWLLAHAVIVRRRLRNPVGASPALDNAGFAANVPPLPRPLAFALESAVKAGYEYFTSQSDLQSIQLQWGSQFPLEPEDRGYEYMALVSFTVSPVGQPFWAPDVLVDPAAPSSGRSYIRLIKLDDTTYKPDPTRISETPRAGAAAISGVAPVPNNERPRAVTIGSLEPFRLALPVPSPPGVRRDSTLLHLLTNPIKRDGVPLPPAIWGEGTDAPITFGQQVMIEQALRRVPDWNLLKPALTDVEHDPRLHDARVILCREFGGAASTTPGPGPTDPAKQHITLGFRGLQELNWSYTPFQVTKARTDEAETVRFRVYSVRVPTSSPAARLYQTAEARGRLIHSGPGRAAYELTVDDPNVPGIDTIMLFEQPAVVRIEGADGVALRYATVGAVSTGNGARVVELGAESVEVSPGALPQQAVLRFYAAQPLVEREIDDASLMITRQYTTFVPVGGGNDEVFGWWISGVSAQGKEAGYTVDTSAGTPRRVAWLRRFGPTIEPATPRGVLVQPPTNRHQHILLPSKPEEARWMPAGASQDDAYFNPRLILAWEPTEKDVLIAVQREAQRVDARKEFTSDALDITPWMAIRNIENAPEGELLDAVWIDKIAGGWLAGSTAGIEPEGVEGDPQKLVHIDLLPWDQGLPGDSGAKTLTFLVLSDGKTVGSVQWAPKQFATLIDYFRDNRDATRPMPRELMDVNARYRYRLVAYLDLSRDPASPPLPPAWRYLRSQPTGWSEFVLPATTPIVVNIDAASQAPDYAFATPSVRFDIQATPIAPALLDEEHAWLYRIVMQRQIHSCIVSTKGTTGQMGWQTVGKPLTLSPHTTGFIEDHALERDRPDEPLSLSYRISVLQFCRDPDGSERLIRSHEPGPVGGASGSFFELSEVTLPKPSDAAHDLQWVIPIRLDARRPG